MAQQFLHAAQVTAARKNMGGKGMAQRMGCGAFRKTEPATPPSSDDLKNTLRKVLPEYMVPSRFGILARLPTTVSAQPGCPERKCSSLK